MVTRRTDKRSSGDAHGVARRWLHEVLFADWGLKLLALAITLGLWYGVAGQRMPETRRLRGIPLEFVQPPDLEISNDLREEVDVVLRGNRRAFDTIVTRDLVVRADIRQFKPGERVLRLTPQTVSLELPEGVEIERIEPGVVPLRLERRIEHEVVVKPRLEGQVPEGFEVRNVHVNPERIKIRGPESHVTSITTVPTETISLEGQRETLTLPQTAIDIDDRKVVPLDPAVSVRVEVAELTTEQGFTNVPVRVAGGFGTPSHALAQVTLRGPRSVLARLNAGNWAVVLEQAEDGSVKAQLSLPPGLEGRAELVSTNPERFSINR